jgi:cephalosporin hydroxylase
VKVILDSNHERDHVLDELRLYSSVVSPGNYLIEFDVDRECEKFFLTFNPGGYLRKRSPGSAGAVQT